MMTIERRSVDFSELRVKPEKRELSGYFIVWDAVSQDLGDFTESFSPGAFTKSLTRDLKTKPIWMGWQHDQTRILASTASRSLEITEDAKGQKFRAILNKTTWANDALEAIRRGDVSRMSFGFQVRQDRWDKETRHRTVEEAELVEISPVTNPAYLQTSVLARNSMTKDKTLAEINTALRDAEATRGRDSVAYRAAAARFDELAPELDCPLMADVGFDAAKRYLTEPVNEPEKINPGAAITRANEKPGPFRSFGEQLACIARAALPGEQPDSRLWDVRAATGASEAIPADGGFLVQTDFSRELWRLVFNQSRLADRVRRLSISDNSNRIKLNAYKETSRVSGSRFGGIQVNWTDEGGQLSATKPEFRQMELVLNKATALFYATSEVIRDASILEQVFRSAFPEELAWTLDDCIINGSGTGKPLGILNGGGLVTASKESGQAGTTFVYENAISMWSRLAAGARGDSVWLINQDVEPQLFTMSLAVGTGGAPVYMPGGGASAAPYASLFGRPVIPMEQCSTLGTLGDVILMSPSHYMLVDKAMQLDSSMHLRFDYDELVFRLTYRVDGQPLVNEAITPASGSGNTLSPYVVLETRS